jgi:putative hemolysin
MVVLVFLVLFVLSGLFSMFELALVSSRKHKLENKANAGSRGAKTALVMLSEPEKMLSTVQSGITLVSIIAGAYGGYALTRNLSPYIEKISFLSPYAHIIAAFIVVSLITYFSLVFAELFPKTVALSNPEKFAIALSPFMKFISILLFPLIHILSISVKFLTKLFRLKTSDEPPVTEEELKILIKQGSDHGVIEKEESEMIREVFRFGDKTAYNLMTPSSQIIFIDKNDPEDVIMNTILNSNFSRFPVCDDSIDNVTGIASVKDILRYYNTHKHIDLSEVITSPLFIPEVMPALKILDLFREKKVHIGIVINEFGTTEGLVTLHDLTESILGDFPAFHENESPEIFRREDGSWLVDGNINIEDLKDSFQINNIPVDYDSDNINTLGGLTMIILNKVPETGDKFELGNYRFEIVDMDGNRVDKVLISNKPDIKNDPETKIP